MEIVETSANRSLAWRGLPYDFEAPMSNDATARVRTTKIPRMSASEMMTFSIGFSQSLVGREASTR
jgi:hypothetical protein